MPSKMTGAEIRQSFIDFFIKRGHTFVRSAPLVPGEDQTLLFTNAGMVQFKDVFLGTDVRPYTRAVNSQKCMRVAGKHNDLDDVGRDDSHHTFFEMLGNWSFGDYYKKEAITWAWELLTTEWQIDPNLLYASCFRDDLGAIPSDEEAAAIWREQPKMDPSHVLYYGRKDNFWEMADTGPCGPCSEIHIDRGAEMCNRQGQAGHVCQVNGDCARYLEIWNLVFIQYNRLSPTKFEPLPARHIDTGMGLDRIVAVLQDVNSNYRTDLFSLMVEKIRVLSGRTKNEMESDFTPYRVIADHARAATFLIADGVIPGNMGRHYITRMIIRRAARFGGKIGLKEPFLAEVGEVVIEKYGQAYPELVKNRKGILENITREEKRFRRTVEAGMAQLEGLLAEIKNKGDKELNGQTAFDLYATHGLPVELTRDVAREMNLEVDDIGFKEAMDKHKVQSGVGRIFAAIGGEEVETFRTALGQLVEQGKMNTAGVDYDPYNCAELEIDLIGLFSDGKMINSAEIGTPVEVILPKTGFYIESGGQVSDTGWIQSIDGQWEIEVDDVRKPSAGIIIHIGRVTRGIVKLGDKCKLIVDRHRRLDIMRNHTATHLLHAQLHNILGEHAMQAGSLVAPDRLRFDFTHPEAVTIEQLEQIEAAVNHEILESHDITILEKPLQEAMREGAMALFGEKYGESVRTVTIDAEQHISYELCGGTHVENTAEIGSFIILSEGSTAAGIRRIEAVTGRAAYEVIRSRNKTLRRAARLTNSSVEDLVEKINGIQDEVESLRIELGQVRQQWVRTDFEAKLEGTQLIAGVPVLAVELKGADLDTLRQMSDLFRGRNPSGIIAIGTVIHDKPMIICAVTEDLVARGVNAGELVRQAAQLIGGSGGGRPVLAQAGGKDPGKLQEALELIPALIKRKLA